MERLQRLIVGISGASGIASGAFRTDGMIVVPGSMHTLSENRIRKREQSPHQGN